MFDAFLWHKGYLGFAGVQRLSTIREAVRNSVDEFLTIGLPLIQNSHNERPTTEMGG
jgi:hypothetical protein